LQSGKAKRSFETALEEARRRYGMLVFGYVVMPEHVHFLVSEPGRELLSTAIQAIKQSVARKLIGEREHFWQARYYDFNLWSASKIREKLRYMQALVKNVVFERVGGEDKRLGVEQLAALPDGRGLRGRD
jgi:putative transposase